MTKRKPKYEKCLNCGKPIYIDQEGDWVHKKPAQKHGDWRSCNDAPISDIAEPKQG